MKGIANTLIESFTIMEDDHGDYVPSQDEINQSAAAPVAPGTNGHPIFSATPEKIARFKQLLAKAQAANGNAPTTAAPAKKTAVPAKKPVAPATPATPATNQGQSGQTAPVTLPPPADDVPDIANKPTQPTANVAPVQGQSGQSEPVVPPANGAPEQPATTNKKTMNDLNPVDRQKLQSTMDAVNALLKQKGIKI